MFLTTLQQKSFVFYFIFRFNSDFQQGLLFFFSGFKAKLSHSITKTSVLDHRFCPLPYQNSFFSNKNTNLLGAHWKIIGLDTQVPRQLLIQGNKTVLTPASPANSNASKPKVLEKGATSVEEWSIFHWQQNKVILTHFSVFYVIFRTF